MYRKIGKKCLNNLLKYFLKIFYIVFLDDIFFHIKAKNKNCRKSITSFLKIFLYLCYDSVCVWISVYNICAFFLCCQLEETFS